MPSHNLDPNDAKNVARLLVALALEHGGELRVKAITYDGLDKGRLLLVDYDRLAGELVIRATSDCGRAMIVPPENASWSRPPEEAPTERARIQAERAVQHRVVRSDQELAEFEERRNQEAELARQAKEGTLPSRVFKTRQ